MANMDDFEIERSWRVYTFKAPAELIEKLDRLAQMMGTTRSDLIRRAIELYIKMESWRPVRDYKIIRLTS